MLQVDGTQNLPPPFFCSYAYEPPYHPVNVQNWQGVAPLVFYVSSCVWCPLNDCSSCSVKLAQSPSHTTLTKGQVCIWHLMICMWLWFWWYISNAVASGIFFIVSNVGHVLHLEYHIKIAQCSMCWRLPLGVTYNPPPPSQEQITRAHHHIFRPLIDSKGSSVTTYVSSLSIV